MAQMTVVDCFAFCVLVASAAWIAAMWIWKGAASESESKIKSKQSEQLDRANS